MFMANPFAARNGTPLPIALNEFVRDALSDITNSLGKDCIAKASETDILLAL